jgi:hypothetical protein
MLLIAAARANALVPMLVTPAGMLMLDSEFAPSNADSPMLVTPAGMVMLVIPEPEKALSPMPVTLEGITTAPVQDDPSLTTRLVIVKFGVELDVSPVVHRYVPSDA